MKISQAAKGPSGEPDILSPKVALPDPLSDEEVVRRVLAGEKQLFELVMRRYNQRLYRTARSFGLTDADCDDILQQTYLQAYEKLMLFRGEARFSTWLTRILINLCLMQRRVIKPQLPGEIPEPLFTGNPTNPEQELARQELRRLLETVVESLPEAYRKVYVMREIEELSVSETAECLSLSEANIKVRLHRARQMMRKQLEAELHPSDLFEFGSARCDALVRRVLQKIG